VRDVRRKRGAVHEVPQAEDERGGEDHDKGRARREQLGRDELRDSREAKDREGDGLERRHARGHASDAGDESEGNRSREHGRGLAASAQEFGPRFGGGKGVQGRRKNR
jgi:hypothetical protein